MTGLRRDEIRRFIAAEEVVSVRDLNRRFPGVSAMTLHRDLKYLEDRGEILRLRGAARALPHVNEPGYWERDRINSAAKAAMAKKAVALFGGEGTVFFDAGTSCMAVARELKDAPVTVFTSSPVIALELIRLSKLTVSLCGGTLSHENLALAGQSALDMLGKVNIDIAFIGISGFRKENGFCCGREDEAQVKKLVIGKARKAVGLMDNSKLDRILPFTFARPGDFDYLVCEDGLPESFAQAMRVGKCTIV